MSARLVLGGQILSISSGHWRPVMDQLVFVLVQHVQEVERILWDRQTKLVSESGVAVTLLDSFDQTHFS